VKHWSEETNWQRLGDIVAHLKNRVNDAIARRDDFAGEAAHEDLICAEHRLRMAERGLERNG
jgi:hypothetical protein